jgi:hypothetical protein
MPNTEKISNVRNSGGLLLDGAVRKFMQRPWARCASGMDVSLPAAWRRRSQDDVETSRAKSLCGYEGRID